MLHCFFLLGDICTYRPSVVKHFIYYEPPNSSRHPTSLRQRSLTLTSLTGVSYFDGERRYHHPQIHLKIPSGLTNERQVTHDPKTSAKHRRAIYGWRMVALGCAIRMLGGGFHL